MAGEDFIAPIQPGQGSASSGGQNRTAIDYRTLQNPATVNTDLPSSGGAERAAELSRVFKEFSSEAGNVSTTLGTQAGAIAGAASGATGHPQYRQGLERFSAYSQAFNNAATGAYAIQAEAFADDTAARLRVEANNDPAHFATTFSAVRDAVVKQAPPQAQAELTHLYNERLAAGMAAISGAQAAEIKQTQRQVYDEGVQRDTSRVAKLQGSALVQDQLQAQDELVKLTAKINGGVNSGLYSPAEAEAKLIGAHREITSQVFETQVDAELGRMGQSGDAGDVVKLLNNFQAMHEKNLANPNEPPTLSETEYNQLMSNAKQKLMQERLIQLYTKSGLKTAEEQKLEAGDVKITAMMASNTAAPVLQRTVASMVLSGDLKPEVGRAVLSSIQRGVDAPPDKRAQYFAENDPDRFNWTTEQILAKVNGNAAQGMQLASKIASEKAGWEGHSAIKDARALVASELKLPSGMALEMATDEQKLAATKAQVEFTQRMVTIDPSARDAQAPRVAKNVVLEMQARDAEAKAAAFTRGQGYLDRTYGPKGSSPNATSYAKGLAELQKSVADANAEAARLRQGIKQ